MLEKDKRIQELKDVIKKDSRNPKCNIIPVLKELDQLAKENRNDELFGFVYFHYADYYYFIKPDQKKFYHYLKKAISYLLLSENEKLLSQTYNLFAVDAHNSGNYTVAFQYYLIALELAKDNEANTLIAATNANMARILMELDNSKYAEEHLLKSIDTLKDDKNSSIYYSIVIYYLRGVNCVFLKKKKEAKKCLAQMKEYISLAGLTRNDEYNLMYLFLETLIECNNPKTKKIDRIIDQMLIFLDKNVAVFDSMEDIAYLGRYLLHGGYINHVGRILDVIRERIIDSNIMRIMRLFYELELKYNEVIQNKDGAYKDMLGLDTCYAEQVEDQYRYNLLAMEFSAMVAKLRDKQDANLKESERLLKTADIDALTGLPNRYAMNDELDKAFDNAIINKTSLGIGILDIDYFKEYNDEYGHKAGDVCLNAIAGSLRRLSKKEGVFVARYGGDEFVIIIEEADEKRIEDISRELDEDIMASKILHKASPISKCVTVSQGYCYGKVKMKTKIWDYLSEADIALYEMKKARKSSSIQIPIKTLK